MAYVISSVVAADTFSILHLSSTEVNSSPFSLFCHVLNPYFTEQKIRHLFHQFAEDDSINVNDNIIKDLWARLNGNFTYYKA